MAILPAAVLDFSSPRQSGHLATLGTHQPRPCSIRAFMGASGSDLSHSFMTVLDSFVRQATETESGNVTGSVEIETVTRGVDSGTALGGAAGGIAVFLVLVACAFYILRSRKRKDDEEEGPKPVAVAVAVRVPPSPAVEAQGVVHARAAAQVHAAAHAQVQAQALEADMKGKSEGYSEGFSEGEHDYRAALYDGDERSVGRGGGERESGACDANEARVQTPPPAIDYPEMYRSAVEGPTVPTAIRTDAPFNPYGSITERL